MSLAGTEMVMKGIVGVARAWGPMSRDVESLVLFHRSIWAENSQMFRDPSVAPVPFRSDLYEADEPLTIGYYMGEGNFEVSGIFF